MTLLEAVKLMRGRKGTKIIIHIYREGFAEPKPFEIVRDVVQLTSVKGEMLEPGYAYLRVSAFQERTDQELSEALEKLHGEAPDGFAGLVLDLRDNPGGLLDQAVRVSDFWLDGGVIVYTQGREASQRQDYLATALGVEADYPLVVLVNEGSASASEIVAGALQDQHRALVLGVETFGKGSVQTVYPLEGGAGLRLTTALYYTPAGRSIQEKGIVPDIEVANATPTRLAAKAMPRRVRERDLEGHFTHEEADPDAAPVAVEGDGDGEDGEASEDATSDPQLERGLEVLKSWSYFERLREGREASSVTVQAELAPDAPRKGGTLTP
jgi:carboxyl-terminal processing protease